MAYWGDRLATPDEIAQLKLNAPYPKEYAESLHRALQEAGVVALVMRAEPEQIDRTLIASKKTDKRQ